MSNLINIKESVLAGERINREAAQIIWEQASLGDLATMANSVRQRIHPNNIVSFLIDRNINYTNVCNSDCTFCGFYRHDPKHPEAYVLSKEIIGKKIQETLAFGGTRILLQGGHNDQLKFDFYVDMISWIKNNYKIELNAFSPSEVQQMMKVSGLSAEEVLTTLKDAGLNGLPGGGAEILDDEIRSRVSPKKIKAQEWLDIMEVAQSLDLTTTATMVIGFGETITHRLNHIERLRNLQDKSNSANHVGFNAFISWPLQHNENTSLGRSKRANTLGAGPVEFLRWTALSRIYLDSIPNHQASWPSCGPDIAEVGLHMGCNDFGSTMLEENVVSQAGGHTAKQPMMTPEDLVFHIRRAGYTAAQRDSSFNILKIFE